MLKTSTKSSQHCPPPPKKRPAPEGTIQHSSLRSENWGLASSHNPHPKDHLWTQVSLCFTIFHGFTTTPNPTQQEDKLHGFSVVTINYATRNFKLILPEEHLANHMFHQKMLNEAIHKQVSGNEEDEPLAKLLIKKKNV